MIASASVWTARACAIVSVGLLARVFFAGGETAPGAWTVFIAFGLPYVVLLLLLMKPRPAVLALAAGTAGVAFVGLAPLAGLSILFSGFAVSRSQVTSIESLILLVLVQVLLVSAAIAGYVAFPRDQRRPEIWAVALLVPTFYAFLAVFVVRGRERTVSERRTQKAAMVFGNERAMQVALKEVQKCLHGYATRHPDEGFPHTPTALAAAGCRDARLAAPGADGYRIEFLPGVSDPSGRVKLYSLCARPVADQVTGRMAIVTNQTERSARVTASGSQPTSCADMWSSQNEMPFRMEHCLLSWAAQNPAKGYPDSLDKVGPQGTGCLAVRREWGPVYRNSAVAFGFEWFYRPALRGADGAIRSFVIHGRPVWYDRRSQTPSLRLDDGVLRATSENRLARSTDLGWEDYERSRSALRRAARPTPNPEEGLVGDPQAPKAPAEVFAAGEKRAAQGDLVGAFEAYTDACAREFALACYETGRAYERGLGTKRDLSRAFEAYRQGCDLDSGNACERLALRADRGEDSAANLEDAVDLYWQACNKRSRPGCRRLSDMFDAGRGVLADPDRAVQPETQRDNNRFPGSVRVTMPPDQPPAAPRGTQTRIAGAPMLGASLLRPRYRLLEWSLLEAGAGFVVTVDDRAVFLTSGRALFDAGRFPRSSNGDIDLGAEIRTLDLFDLETGGRVGSAERLLVCQPCRTALRSEGDFVAFEVSEPVTFRSLPLAEHPPGLGDRVWVVLSDPVTNAPTLLPAVVSASANDGSSFQASIDAAGGFALRAGLPVLDGAGRVLGMNSSDANGTRGRTTAIAGTVQGIRRAVRESRKASLAAPP